MSPNQRHRRRVSAQRWSRRHAGWAPGPGSCSGCSENEPREVARAARRAWQHSLQLRVGATTLVVTGVGVLFIGMFLVNQISAGVLRAKRTAAVLQATAGLDTVRRVFADVSPGDIPSQNAAVTSAQSQLAATGSQAGLFTITIESANTSVSAGSQNSPEIPKSLRILVQDNNLAVQYAPIPAAERIHRSDRARTDRGRAGNHPERRVRALLPVPAHGRGRHDRAGAAHGAAWPASVWFSSSPRSACW